MKIGGSIEGGSTNLTGYLNVSNTPSISVGGDVAGHSAQGTNGDIFAQAVGTVKIGGSVSGPGAPEAGDIFVTRAISISIGGDLQSGTVQAGGVESVKTPAQAMVLKSLTIGGSVTDSTILAGSFEFEEVQVGTVKVLGNWDASNLVVGAQNLGTDNAPDGTDGCGQREFRGCARQVSPGQVPTATSFRPSPASPSEGRSRAPRGAPITSASWPSTSWLSRPGAASSRCKAA